MEFQKGDILEGTHREFAAAYHYIVYLGQSLDNAFVGVILTKSGSWANNVPLSENFFVREDEFGTSYKVQYKNSHFMQVKLDKPQDWGPYSKVGQITAEGVKFIEEHISGMEPISYQNYEKSLGTT
ncbi:hypothetical protein HNV11_23700 (plasmid) [Spirosoma taeanense]|uniref:Uncharacterized protein n=1 Tax=Spirosoma taeanense TaxID=2735870 RepID=A0A6M5YEQ3_9BACT|nr:hypothetical protein [Spirosoma taeanense]QJW92479.1 hypothetical protein HNV11_23700 [Spirosoma taeanense]